MQRVPNIDREILFNTKVDQLPRICLTNNYFDKICQTQNFWTEYYQRHGLILLEPQPNTNAYINDFKACSEILPQIDDYLNIIKSKRVFDDDSYRLTLHVNIQSIKHFFLPEVNQRKLERMDSVARLNNSDNYRERTVIIMDRLMNDDVLRIDYDIGGIFLAALSYSTQNKNYELTFMFQNIESDSVEYHTIISENSVRTLIYIYIYYRYRFEFDWIKESDVYDFIPFE